MAAFDLLGLLKAELGITGTDQDQMLGALLEGAMLQIEAWCMLSLSGKERTSLFQLDEAAQTRPIVLDGPVLAIVSVKNMQTDNMMDDAQFNQQADMLYPVHAWHSCALQVIYRSGYDLATNDVPAAIVRALIMLAAGIYAQAGRDPLLKSESVAGVGSTSWVVPDATTGGMPAGVASLLAPYRRIGIA